jgi:cytochrome o ubiquinol oxidase subunit 2
MVVVAVIIGASVFLGSREYAVLDAKGTIATQQRNLLIFATILSLVIIAPVFALTYHIVRTYRVDAKKKAVYTPDWDHSHVLETLWWGIPSVIILLLSVVAWQSSHSLDPFKSLVSDKKPLTIQVVALEWKWLFIYPEQNLATVNYVQFPANRPVTFQITADAPMNSFWIPQLGGQVYAMSGMTTKLNLMADQPGIFQGSSANLSGKGFSGMRFKAQATTEQQFTMWAKTARTSHETLTSDKYDRLAQPSSDTPPTIYALGDNYIYDKVMSKYMGHGAGMGTEKYMNSQMEMNHATN